MVSPTTSSTDFYQVYEDLQHQHPPQWLTNMRRAGIEGFAATGFPTRKHEEYKYTNVKALQERQFNLPRGMVEVSEALLDSLVSNDAARLVLVDGRFVPQLSHWEEIADEVDIQAVADILSQEENTLQHWLGQPQRGVYDPFAGLNQALFQDGVLIRVKAKAVIDSDIHIVNLFSGTTPDTMAFPRHGIAIGQSAEVSLIETSLSLDPAACYFHNGQTNLSIAANASVRYTQVQTDSQAAYHVHNTHVEVEQDSQVDLFTLTVGGKLVRNNLDVVLNGSGIDITLNGLYAVRDQQHVDNHTVVDHRHPNSVSSQLYKGLLSGQGRTVFNGKIFVRSAAQQTNAYQLNRNLLLSEGTEADTKPQLEIFADDVRCTHGATAGSINEDELFYLESRGIAHDQAVSLLSHGFVEDVLTSIEDEDLQQRLRDILNGYFTAIEGTEA